MHNKLKYSLVIILLLFSSCEKGIIFHTSLTNYSKSNDIVATDTIYGVFGYGQSLIVGGDGSLQNAVISTTQQYNSLMFNLGVRSLDFKVGSTPSSFVPLVEKLSNNTVMGETPCSGFCDMYVQANVPNNFQLFACSSGQPSQTIADLSKGGQYYQRLINNITSAYNIAKNNGKVFIVKWILFTQGEANYTNFTSYDDYYNSLLQLEQDVNNDIAAITGQTTPALFILTQCASQNRNTQSQVNPTVALVDLNLAVNNPSFTLSTPMYQFSYLDDNTHLNDTNYRRLGAYDAIAANTKDFIYPISCTGNSNKITVTFHTSSPITFDTINVVNPSNYGFTALSSSGSQIKIKSVQLISDSSLQIICASQPTTIQYAINGQLKKAGWQAGARGCLRGTSVITFENYNFYKWCPIFSQTIINL